MAYSHAVLTEDGHLYLETSQDGISKLLGSSRESISKELKALEAAGYIEVRYGRIHIYDLNSLNKTYENLKGHEELTSE